MGKELGIKNSIILNMMYAFVVITVIAAVVSAFFALHDPRTEEEKELDAYEAFVSDNNVVMAIKAVKKVESKYDIFKLESVTYLHQSKNPCVLVVFIDENGEEQRACYSVSSTMLCDPSVYSEQTYKLGALNNYMGKNKEYQKVFSEEGELEIILKEARE